jgi:predicted flap endonuclease-1-like 5' DNA nuclease
MTLIRSKLGAVSPDVAGTTYHFHADRAGRFVAKVHNQRHVACLLAVEHYERVDPLPEPTDPLARQTAPKASPAAPPAPAAPAAAPGTSQAVPQQAPVGIQSIKGIGTQLLPKLAEQGITTLQNIAEMTPETEAKLDHELKLHGRIARDGWIKQAQDLLAAPPAPAAPAE